MNKTKFVMILVLFVVAIVISMNDTIRLTQEKNTLINQNVEFYHLYTLTQFHNQILHYQLQEARKEINNLRKNGGPYIDEKNKRWKLAKN